VTFKRNLIKFLCFNLLVWKANWCVRFPSDKSSVQFSSIRPAIYMTQLRRCRIAPGEQSLKPVWLRFTPDTVVRDVIVMQVCWETVPHTWPSGSKAPVTKINVVCVRRTANDLSVDKRNHVQYGPNNITCLWSAAASSLVFVRQNSDYRRNVAVSVECLLW